VHGQWRAMRRRTSVHAKLRLRHSHL